MERAGGVDAQGACVQGGRSGVGVGAGERPGAVFDLAQSDHTSGQGSVADDAFHLSGACRAAEDEGACVVGGLVLDRSGES